MTRVVYKRSYPETPTSCTLCSGREDDCAHFIFECPFAKMLWNRHTTPRVNTTSKTSFLGLNSEDSRQEEGRGDSYICGAFGYMAASTERASYSMKGQPPLRVSLMRWRVLWQPGTGYLFLWFGHRFFRVIVPSIFRKK